MLLHLRPSEAVQLWSEVKPMIAKAREETNQAMKDADEASSCSKLGGFDDIAASLFGGENYEAEIETMAPTGQIPVSVMAWKMVTHPTHCTVSSGRP